jgi:hypothetical protein
MTARYCPRSIPARIVYRIPRYSIGLSFAQNWIPHKSRTAIRLGAEDFGKKQRANAQISSAPAGCPLSSAVPADLIKTSSERRATVSRSCLFSRVLQVHTGSYACGTDIPERHGRKSFWAYPVMIHTFQRSPKTNRPSGSSVVREAQLWTNELTL